MIRAIILTFFVMFASGAWATVISTTQVIGNSAYGVGTTRTAGELALLSRSTAEYRQVTKTVTFGGFDASLGTLQSVSLDFNLELQSYSVMEVVEVDDSIAHLDRGLTVTADVFHQLLVDVGDDGIADFNQGREWTYNLSLPGTIAANGGSTLGLPEVMFARSSLDLMDLLPTQDWTQDLDFTVLMFGESEFNPIVPLFATTVELTDAGFFYGNATLSYTYEAGVFPPAPPPTGVPGPGGAWLLISGLIALTGSRLCTGRLSLRHRSCF